MKTIIYAELRAFHAVAMAGGFTAAAKQLRITQPTLSSQVAALEARNGVMLFHRRGRKVELTALGASLLEISRRLFDLESEAAALLAAERSLASGKLALGADSPHHILGRVAEFHRRYPGVHISLAIGNSEEILAGLFDYRLDAAVLADVPSDPRLVTRELHRDPIVLFVPREHAWARKPSVDIKDLAGQKMVAREAGSVTRALFEGALARAKVTVDTVLEIESREAVREAVAQGLGFGVISAAEMSPDPRLKAVPLRGASLERGRLEMGEYLVRLGERRPSPAAEAFLALFPDGSTNREPLRRRGGS
jgi:LysR family transcriptional regulator, low CO2-responsive transcriptional regulator